MPTLTTDEPDSHDMDYYYNKYPDRFGIGTKDTDPLTLRILPENVNSTKYCVHNLQYTKLKPLPQTQELTKEQHSIYHFFYFYKLTKEEKINFLQKLAFRGKEKKQNSKQLKQNQQQKNTTNQPRDTSNDLNWFLNYPVTENMEPNTKLNTSLAQQLFNFSKIHLRKFTLGQLISTTPNSTQPTTNQKPPQKQSFNYLLKTIAAEKPEFLTDFLHKSNPSLSPQLNIPQHAYTSTLKNLLTKFTELLFTKLNYLHIFHSHYSIPPHPISDRCKVAINFARLYLFLYNKYQTIHYQKFIEKLELYPLRLSMKYNFEYDAPKPLFSIYNNNRFTITFTEINGNKIRNYIKYQIATTLAEECKKLLPPDFQITEPISLQDRSFLTTKAALFHVHTCKNQDCKLLSDDTEHNFKNISTYFFDKSFENFPAPPKDNPTPKTTPFTPDYSIFQPNQQYTATFKKTIPLHTLNELALKADQKFAEINNSETNPKRTAFYLYSYLKAYLNTAATNDSIADLKLDQALEKFISPSINPHILARIILYFYIQNQPKFSITQIQQDYNQKYFLEAEKFIIKHYDIKIPSIHDDTLFLSSTATNSSLFQ
ncbi:hypothetical protein C2G38_2163355 [Gigaspora rosea]|uniref:Uncharacterized protein n=1 Tax=Gigaspora rosea TaxID=44941 RepID=A0A397W2B8_9GLOM|nr:hypothetical protein C2G38_2163355 [Gigaspora rosea]